MNTKAALIVCFAAAAITSAHASYSFTNFAGQPGGVGNADGTGPAARFDYPNGVAADTQGNIFVADTQNHTIRRVTLAGVVTTIAGTPGLIGSTDGTGSAARFYAPTGIAVDASDNVYVADYGNSTIRKLTLSGGNWSVKTIAGQAGVVGKANGNGTAATFSDPFGIAVDGIGNLYVSDTGNEMVRKITPGGVVSTLVSNSVGGIFLSNYVYPQTNTVLYFPQGIAVDNEGNIYVADAGNGGRICAFTPGGDEITGGPIETSIGNPSGIAVDFNGNIYEANRDNGFIVKFSVSASTYGSSSIGGGLTQAMGVTVDQNGNVFVANTDNQMITEIPADGEATFALAGSESATGSTSGIGQIARFHNPEGVAIDNSSNTYVADTDNQRIAVITTAGLSTVLAGTGSAGYTDGQGPDSVFSANPDGVAVDPSGNVYVVDSGNNRIQKITPSGKITTIVTGLNGPDGLAYSGGDLYFVNRGADTVDMVSAQGGPVTKLGFPADAFTGVAVDPAGNVYVTDDTQNAVLKAPPGGTAVVLTNAASGVNFNSPSGIALDSSSNIYVADVNNSRIVEITAAGVATDIAGTNGFAGYTNGTGTNAEFNAPTGVAVDSSGNIYVTDQLNDAVRMITPGGVVTTIAGSYQAVVAGSSNGIGTNTLFSHPFMIAVDASTNLYVTDSGNRVVRKLTPTTNGEVVSAIAGVVGSSSSTASFNSPADVAVDSGGIVYVADAGNNVIREISPGGIVSTLAGSGSIGSYDGVSNTAGFYFPSSVAVDAASNVYVADTYNHTIRKITGGVVSTLAGSAGFSGSSNGTGSTARFWAPYGVAVDPSGSNVYVADTFNDTIRMINSTSTSNGVVVTVSTIAGTSGTAGAKDGAGTAALFNHPVGVAVYTVSNVDTVYVSDSYNQTIRMLTNKSGAWGGVTTVGGTAGVIGGGIVLGLNGAGSAAEFNYPMGVAVDLLGNVSVADSANNRISLDAVIDGNDFYAQGSGLAQDLLLASGISLFGADTGAGGAGIDVAPSAFVAADAGVYNGLFINTDGVADETSAGMVKGLTISKKGAFTGTLLVNGTSHAFHGSFASNNPVTVTIPHTALSLTLSLVPPQVTGTVADGTSWTANLTAEEASKGTAAAYTMVISPDPNAVAGTEPTNNGSATISRSASAASISATLADGTKFSQSVAVSEAGDAPVYANLYRGHGLVLGWINLDSTNTEAGLAWVHPALTTGHFKDAFTSTNAVVISPKAKK